MGTLYSNPEMPLAEELILCRFAGGLLHRDSTETDPDVIGSDVSVPVKVNNWYSNRPIRS